MVAFLLLAALFALSAEAREWPVVTPLNRTFQIDGALPVSIDVPVLTLSRSVAYVLSCRSDPDEVSCYPDSNGQLSSFRCTLNEPNAQGNMESSLLGEDESATWYTRGQFHVKEITGMCASYPEFGAHRTFRLRGLHLELSTSQVELTESGAIDRLSFAVAAWPDPVAGDEHAAQTGYLRPMSEIGLCRPILKGNERRMCRDWENLGGSWTDCKSIGR